jgi:nucleoside-diphosphate-sugar epimerase
MHLEADISKLTAATGWEPLISPADGIDTLANSP